MTHRLTALFVIACCSMGGVLAGMATGSAGAPRPVQTSPDPYAEIGLAVTGFRMSPARPRAGRLFSVQMRLIRTDTGQLVRSGRVSCRATINRRAIRLASRGFRRGWARCAWRLPRSARGKTLRGSIRVRTLGVAVTRTFARRVR